MTENFLTVREAAARLRLTTYTVYRMVKAGQLRALRLGRTVRIYQDFESTSSTSNGGAPAPTLAVPEVSTKHRHTRKRRNRV